MVCKRFGPVKPFNNAVVRSVHGQTSKKYSPIIWNGESRSPMAMEFFYPRYQLPPMIASFMQEEDEFKPNRKGNLGSQRTRGSLVIINILRPVQGILAIIIPIPQVSVTPANTRPAPTKAEVQITRMYELSNCGSNHYQGSGSNAYFCFERHHFHLQPPAIHLPARRKYPSTFTTFEYPAASSF